VAMFDEPQRRSNTSRGSWHCDGLFPSTGRKISAALIFTWYPRTGSIVKQHDDEAPNHFHAVELWAVSTEGLKNTIADASGGVTTYGGGYTEVTTTHSELFADVAASMAVSRASSGNVCVRMERMSSNPALINENNFK
jgi:hypothetical protein